MRFAGRIYKDGKDWLAEIPILDLMTQGHSKKEALTMTADMIESLVNLAGFQVHTHAPRGETFEVSASADAPLVALLLRRQREKSGLSLAEVAERLGERSKNSYARYEQGKVSPSVEKFARLLHSVMSAGDFTIIESQG